ncbi:MAG: ribonuclease Y [Patescibacteria group bacterium]|nr:ribonuclease Y [Patescibacteria group bacterium]
MTTGTDFWLLGGLIVLCVGLGYFVRLIVAKRIGATLEQKIKVELEAARTEAKEIIIAAKDKASSILVEVQKEERERKQEIRHLEERLAKKEDALEQERLNINVESDRLKKEFQKIESLETDAKLLREKAVKEMERVAGLSREEAKGALFRELEQEYKDDLKDSIVKLEKDRRDQVEAKALEIITSTIQRYARDHVIDVTTTVVELPNEEIKGKIIGREGRNIRTFERLTGVEVIVDETPESILLSSFDPMRRELAKIALEKLIKDGRIQPAKIEEKVEEARLELDSRIRKIGEEAGYEVGILDLPKEILFLLGRLNYRTSYGQNVLQHSIEMAHIATMIASELKLNVAVTKKAALLHDIGKAIDHEVEGTHVDLGRKILKKYNIDETVIYAMEAHHEEYPFSSPESYVVAAADAISAARPGARRDTLEKYLKRLEEIEKVVNSFDGVKQSYAVSAGREVRVFVVPEKIDDFGALQLAKKVAGKIQSDIQYPGEIKVTVIREVKAVEYAR